MKFIAFFLIIFSGYVYAETYVVTHEQRKTFTIGGGLSLYRENGKTLGFKVKKPMPGSMFENAGFNEGDLVTHINGFDVRESGSVSKAYAALTEEDKLDVRIERAPMKLPLTIRIEFKVQ